MPNFIKRIGLELEGGWRNRPAWDVRRDGSVEIPRAELVGEISSPPYSMIENAEAWMRKYYPQTVNHTCGFHIHISLAPGHYSMLMCEEFYAKFIAAYRKWGEETFRVPAGAPVAPEAARFYERLNGGNRFCQAQFNPDIQTQVVSRQNPTVWDTRYAQLNYCWTLHGTMESRLLPMFNDVNMSASAMRVFPAVVNEYLTEIGTVENVVGEQEAVVVPEEEVIRIPDETTESDSPRLVSTDSYEDLLESILPRMAEVRRRREQEEVEF
jgi:hypothetical protein